MNSKYFTQDSPKLGNQYLEDNAIRDIVHRYVPKEIVQEIEPDLIRFGDRVLGDVLEYGNESESNPPKLINYDAWGKRIDQVVVTNGWKQLQSISAEEGLMAIAYERKYKEFRMVAARLIELYGDQGHREAYDHLTSRDPTKFWTSGQWMTEKTGGSDVGNSETIATKNKDGTYSLHGYKFFTSASTSQMTVLLARMKDDKGNVIKGSRGLSTFFVKMHKEDGQLNNLIVHKLKNKLGTKAVPTAEIELMGTVGTLIGKANQGVKVISTILNITRIHNAISCASAMRRGIAIARDYCHRRSVFGKSLTQQSLHLETIANLEVEFRAALQFVMNAVYLLGKIESKSATKEDEILFRLITPLLKLYTAKQAIAVASECIESLGGTGYMEDSNVPKILRDVQVCSIWEGTTNVLSLDVWRSLKSEGAFEVYVNAITAKINNSVNVPTLSSSVQKVHDGLSTLRLFANECITSGNKDFIETHSRSFAFGLSRVYMASLLIEHAQWSNNEIDKEVVNRWCKQTLVDSVPKAEGSAAYTNLSKKLALDINEDGKTRGHGPVDPLGKPRSRM